MNYIKRSFAIFWTLALSLAAWFIYLFRKRQGLDLYKDLILAPTDENAPGLRVTFLGVSTLLFSDGETSILTDGFFTRPGKLRTFFTRLRPDRDLITRYLQFAGIKNLKAVIVLHSHIDHAFDSPEVARQTGAQLIGSDSTANIAHGYGFPEKEGATQEEAIHVIHDHEVKYFGRFKVTFFHTCHSPISLLSRVHIRHVLLHGNIKHPVKLPARGCDYKEGGSYTLLIEHDGKKILVQASAGFKRGALNGLDADVVFLGIATLGQLPKSYRKAYWREVVETTNPQRIIPIHWDDFSKSLCLPLVPMPQPFDDFEGSMNFVIEHAKASAPKIDVRILDAWTSVDPFAGI